MYKPDLRVYQDLRANHVPESFAKKWAEEGLLFGMVVESLIQSAKWIGMDHDEAKLVTRENNRLVIEFDGEQHTVHDWRLAKWTRYFDTRRHWFELILITDLTPSLNLEYRPSFIHEFQMMDYFYSKELKATPETRHTPMLPGLFDCNRGGPNDVDDSFVTAFVNPAVQKDWEWPDAEAQTFARSRPEPNVTLRSFTNFLDSFTNAANEMAGMAQRAAESVGNLATGLGLCWETIQDLQSRIGSQPAATQESFEGVYPPTVLDPESNRCELIPMELACDPAALGQDYTVVITELP